MQQPAKLCTGNRVLGSNPSLSATENPLSQKLKGFFCFRNPSGIYSSEVLRNKKAICAANGSQLNFHPLGITASPRSKKS